MNSWVYILIILIVVVVSFLSYLIFRAVENNLIYQNWVTRKIHDDFSKIDKDLVQLTQNNPKKKIWSYFHYVDEKKPTLVFFHGNANMAFREKKFLLDRFSEFNYGDINLMVLEYTGYHLNYCSNYFLNENVLVDDCVSAINYLIEKKNIDPKNITIYGASLGGTLALHTITSHKFEKYVDKINGVIVENIFLNFPRVYFHHTGVPFHWFKFLFKHKYDNGKKTKKVKKDFKIGFVSSQNDQLVPPWHMKELYLKCSSEKKIWKSIKNSKHADPLYHKETIDFIANFANLKKIKN